MSPRGDDDAGMKATRHIHDDVIEAIVSESVHDVHAPLMAFADQVRALGDEPVPVPSHELTAVLAGRAVPVPGADLVPHRGVRRDRAVDQEGNACQEPRRQPR